MFSQVAPARRDVAMQRLYAAGDINFNNTSITTISSTFSLRFDTDVARHFQYFANGF
jgi:hypothetical protein